jgi:hypothetical protein
VCLVQCRINFRAGHCYKVTKVTKVTKVKSSDATALNVAATVSSRTE